MLFMLLYKLKLLPKNVNTSLYMWFVKIYTHFVAKSHLKLLPLPAPCGMLPSGLSEDVGLLSCRRLLCFEIQASSSGCPAGLEWGPRNQGAVLPFPRDFFKPCIWISFVPEAWTWVDVYLYLLNVFWHNWLLTSSSLAYAWAGEFNGELGIISVF